MKTFLKKYAALIGALCTVMLVISGCAFDDLQIAKNEPGTGTVKLSINGANARTIYPEVEFEIYQVSIYKGDWETNDELDLSSATASDLYRAPSQLDGVTADLYLRTNADYTIVVEAYVEEEDFADPDKVAAIGYFVIKNLAEDAEVTANVFLKAIDNDGEGTFSWDIGFDASIEKAEIEVDNQTIEIHGANAVSDNFVVLDAGTYLVKFTLEFDNGSTLSFVEDLYIFKNLTSKYENSFREINFYEMIDYVLGIFAKNESLEAKLAELYEEFFDEMLIDYDNDFDAVKAEFATLIEAGITPLLPGDVNELNALVDAALVKIGVSAKYDTQAVAKAAIDPLALNGTVPVYSSKGKVLTIKLGEYTVTTELDPAFGCLDAEINDDYEAIPGSTPVFSLATWINGKTWESDANDNAPIYIAGGGVLALVNNGINRTTRTNGYDAVDIQLTNPSDQPGIGINSKQYIYTITVYGIALSNIGGNAYIENNVNISYGTQVKSVPVGADGVFKLTYTLPDNYTDGNTRVRVALDRTNPRPDFRITLIEIEYEQRTSCECAGCDLYGYTVYDVAVEEEATGNTLYCICDAPSCTHSCTICISVGISPLDLLDIGGGGTKKTITRTGLDVIADLATLYAAGKITGSSAVVKNIDGVLVKTTLGGGIQILKSDSFVPDFDVYDYYITVVGRGYSPMPSGTRPNGIFHIRTFTNWDSPNVVNGGSLWTATLNAKITSEHFTTGLYFLPNIYNGTYQDGYIHSIDDLIIYREAKPVPAAPFNAVLVFQKDGEGENIDWKQTYTGGADDYSGITARLDLTGMENIRNYNRVTVKVMAFDDVEGTNEIFRTATGNNTNLFVATLFQPWNDTPEAGKDIDGGYGADAFPGYNTPGRMVNIDSAVGTNTATANISLSTPPEGFRVERGGGWAACPVRALKLVSVQFWHSEYEAP